MTSLVKQSAIMFLTIFLFHCCNAKYFIVETKEGDGNEIYAGDDHEEYDDDQKSGEDDGDELPDDLQLLNDDLELGSTEDGGMGTENDRGGNQGYMDLRHPKENNFLSLI